jgi:hypothetical protein
MCVRKVNEKGKAVPVFRRHAVETYESVEAGFLVLLTETFEAVE